MWPGKYCSSFPELIQHIFLQIIVIVISLKSSVISLAKFLGRNKAKIDFIVNTQAFLVRSLQEILCATFEELITQPL